MRFVAHALLLCAFSLAACTDLLGLPGGEGGELPGPGGGGGPGAGERLDEKGVCRASASVEAAGCARDFAAAKALMPRCGYGCTGPCGDRMVFIDFCEPSRACAYDPVTWELEAATLEAEGAAFCEGKSRTLTWGGAPVDCRFEAFDPLVECTGSR